VSTPLNENELVRVALVEYFNDGRELLEDFDGDDVRAMADAVAAVLAEVRKQDNNPSKENS
jgi:hypothetical protein